MKRFLATIIALLMIASTVSPVIADETTTVTASYSGSILRASFASEPIKLNGTPAESGWVMTAKIGKDSAIGAQWDQEDLYLAIRNSEKADVSVTLNGILLTKENATIKSSSNKKNTEVSVPLKTVGATGKNYNEEIPAKIQLGDNVWEGKIILSAIQWMTADNATKVVKGSTSKSGTRIVDVTSAPTNNQGVESITAGHRFFDRYDPNGANPPAIFTSTTITDKAYDALGDRTIATLQEFDFCAKSMPVYKLGEMPDHWDYHQSSGFCWSVSDTAEGATAAGYTFSIMNTAAGLIFTVHNGEEAFSQYLDKQIGDAFRVGVLMNPDDSVTLFIDGEAIRTFENARFTNEYFAGLNCFYGIRRSPVPAESEKDNFEIDITNIAVGKYYGEKKIDVLDCSMLLGDSGDNAHQYAVMGDLSLPGELSHPHFTAPVTLTWESSDSTVIDPTGKVTRPAENGKLVTLTATDSDGETKEFEFFVKGRSPQGNVLTVTKDIAAHSGAGQLIDVHEYAFDQTNNSIILDLGESKAVNVIVLKDSDEVTRLNESMLTIWASNDNKSYTQAPSFKLLRAGQYTYLYDFDMTGRYIKVHCTSHYAKDSDFIAPLDGMIDAYYENVFGDGGSAFAKESSVTLTNDTDTAKYDTAFVITPAEAEVQCAKEDMSDVRFYLGRELLYHYYNGENFVVRVPKIAKNASVTIKVLSGNADAADISGKEYVYEAVYGTRETYLGNPAKSRWVLPRTDGVLMSFRNATLYENGTFIYSLSNDNGYTWIGDIQGVGSYAFLVRPIGMYQDEETGRILLAGSTYYRDPNGGANDYSKCETSFMYSDDLGKTWERAEFISPTGEFPTYLYSYCDIIQTSVSDGEDGPNVDYVFMMHHNSKEATAEYKTGYEVSVSRTAYTKDGGKTWYLGKDEIAYHGGEGIHRREMGTCEGAFLEAPNGTLVAYMRCQFDGITKLAYAVSHDYGDTWSDAELSDVYGTNTQPEMWTDQGHKFMVWAGNTLFGQNSFRRYPLNFGIFHDDALMEIEGIQDIFSRTSMQGMSFTSERDVVNPKIAVLGDDIYIGWDLRSVRVNNYLDYFFKTKGVYDSFENSTVKYEGWMNDGGELGTDDTHATDGKKSMYFTAGSGAVRSIPQVQNGTVSFDLYIEDVTKTSLEFEFEAGFSRIYGEGAPVALQLVGNKATFLGASESVALDIKEGWNTFVFELSLLEEMPTATLSVNGSAPVSMPVNEDRGAYATFVSFTSMDAQTYYLDNFFIDDRDNAFVPDEEVSAAPVALTEVPENLKNTVLANAEGYTAENTAAYSLSPLESSNGGDTWSEADSITVPRRGMSVLVPYPADTAKTTHAFRAADKNGNLLSVTETADGIVVTALSTEPIILAWSVSDSDETDPSDTSDISEPDTDTEGESSMVWVIVGIGAVVVIAIVAVVLMKSKKKSA